MVKCKCVKCGNEETYVDHKDAWMSGWGYVMNVKNNFNCCEKCEPMGSGAKPIPYKNEEVEVE